MLYRLLRAITPLRAAVCFGREHLVRYHLQVWRLEGRERASDAPLTILFAGQLENKNYLAHLAFAEPYVEVALGRRWLWLLLPRGKGQEPHEIDLRIVELQQRERHWLLGRFRFFVPCWIGGEVEFARVVERMQHSKNAKEDMRRMRKHETTYEVTREPEMFEQFYTEMYLPYIRNVYGDHAFLMSRTEMLDALDCCELFFVKVHGERVAGQILVYENGRARAWSVGFKDGDRSHLKAGANKALDYLMVGYLAEKGYKSIHMGASRPFLLDGALIYKKRLGMSITNHEGRGFALQFADDSPGAQAFLANNPFIYESDGHYKGAVFVSETVLASEGRCAELRAQYQMEGLSDISLFPLRTAGEPTGAALEPANDGRSTTKRARRATLPSPGPLVGLLRAAVRFAPTRWKLYDRSIVLRKILVATDGVVLPEGHQWVWAGPDELKVIDGHPEATSRSAYARRLGRGDSCLCLKNGTELVGYRWIAWHSGCLYCGFGPRQEITFLPLQQNQAFLYDLYVYEAYRKRGYGTLLLMLTFKALAGRGIDEVFALVDPDNHKMIRLDLRLGFEAVSMAYGFRIRQWRAMLYGPRAEQSQLQAWMQRFKPNLALG